MLSPHKTARVLERVWGFNSPLAHQTRRLPPHISVRGSLLTLLVALSVASGQPTIHRPCAVL